MSIADRNPRILNADIYSYRIYPSIGVARVGNSTANDGWYYAPEVPGRFDTPQGGFKDAQGAVKRQAARFRVYAFGAQDKVICEATVQNGFEVKWSLEVANQKAAWYTFMGAQQEGAFEPGYTTLRNPTVQPDRSPEKRDRLIVNSGVKSVSGANAQPVTLQGQFYGDKAEPTSIYLGEARTDESGRLVVLAGRGLSQSVKDKDDPYPLIMNDFDSPDWIDDTCDGWIEATVKFVGVTKPAAYKARVLGSTPKFANGIYAPTSLYDVMEEVSEQSKRGPGYDVPKPDWYKDIWPLLQRPALLSWVNGQANGGHGPNGPGNFFDEKWQQTLSDDSAENEPIRRGVLGRMRLPATNEKYDRARAGQSYPYFMPWLSGDNGRTIAGDQSKFASVTELQYDRLVKWSKGEFTKAGTEPPPPPASIEELDLHLQPAALTKAALEATIGAPLYPGIEMSWNAEKAELYAQGQPFVIDDKVVAGDLTKYLSLPWQSDFYMCRSYWWPSARPDAIVTEEEYNKIVAKFPLSDIAKQLTERVPWERGIHQNYTDTFGDQPLFANTDMAQRWHQLGFIVQKPSSSSTPIFVETQRNLKSKDLKSRLPSTGKERTGLPHGGGVKLPIPAPGEHAIDTVASLREHLLSAMRVELSTIPIYLYGMYSVKTPEAFVNDPRYYDPIMAAVRGIVAEEMLHLSLAGNILLAIGGEPKLYVPEGIPKYPMAMPGRIPDLTMHLRKLSKENLETFIEIEKPKDRDAPPEPDKYHTLGQFYDAIADALKHLDTPQNHLFHPKTAPFQFAPGLGYQARYRDAGGSVIVTDLASAQEAITIIVDQGEGHVEEDNSVKGHVQVNAQGEATGDPFVDPDHLELCHYNIFLNLQTDSSKKWETYPVLDDPTTLDYLNVYHDENIYQVSLTFDAAYCFLLLTIEKLWTIESDDKRHKLVLGNMFGVMMGVLAPLAKFLMAQKIGNEGKTAAPCFGYYRFDDQRSTLKQLQEEMQTAIDVYVDVNAETPDQVAVHNYGPELEVLLPIQNTIKGLVDLDTFKKIAVPNVKLEQPAVQTRGDKGFARGY